MCNYLEFTVGSLILEEAVGSTNLAQRFKRRKLKRTLESTMEPTITNKLYFKFAKLS